MSRKITILSGRTFGNLTVLRIAESPDSTGHARWVCSCKLCGQESVHLGYNLRRMHVVMCHACAKRLHQMYCDEGKYPSRYPEYRLLCHARERAKDRGIPCTITLDDIRIPEFCPVLHIRLKKGHGRHCDSSPTIDRIVPSMGYTPSNTWVISFRANHLKANGTLDDFESLCREMRARMGITPIGPATVATAHKEVAMAPRMCLKVWKGEDFDELFTKEAI